MSVDVTMQTFREDNLHGFTTQVLARPYKLTEIPQLEPNDILDLHGPRPTGLPLLARTAGVDSQFGRNARFECTITEFFGNRALPVPYSWHLVITVDGDDWPGAVRQLGKVAGFCDVMGVDVGSNEGGDKIKTLLRTQLPAQFRRGRVKAIKGIATHDWKSTEVIQGGRQFRDGKPYDDTISVYHEIGSFGGDALLGQQDAGPEGRRQRVSRRLSRPAGLALGGQGGVAHRRGAAPVAPEGRRP